MNDLAAKAEQKRYRVGRTSSSAIAKLDWGMLRHAVLDCKQKAGSMAATTEPAYAQTHTTEKGCTNGQA